MNVQNNGFLSIEQLTDQYLAQSKKATTNEAKDGLSFRDVLQQKTAAASVDGGEVKFSKHASVRMADRNIELSDTQLERLNDGVRKAEQKGIKDSLVIVDELAFIVNVPNNTVVTAMDSTEANENVFTNINGAVIM